MPTPEGKPHVVAHADESCQHADGSFYVQYITENEAGFSESRLRYPTLEAAISASELFNLQRGHTTQRVQAVRMSSFAAGRVTR